MEEENARILVEALKEAKINYVAYLPDSFFFDMLKIIEKDPDFTSISVPNECTGLCMCAGAWLGGKKPVMIMENSGILVSAYGIIRMHHAFGIPVLLLTSYRGDVGDPFWWSIPFGQIYEPVLKALSILYVLVRNTDEARRSIIDSQISLEVAEIPRAVVFRRNERW